MSPIRPVFSALSRTSSTTSVSSSDTSTTGNTNNPKRTRKRFTNVQVTMLEALYHETSHPTREQREKVVKDGGMEIKSVTIWFQNKRQSERKFALYNATNDTNSSNNRNKSASSAPARHTTGTTPSTLTRPRTHHRTSSGFSLDTIASRSELPAPRTPTRKARDPHAPLWASMPSSPLGPAPQSPPARDREYIAFGRSRTLEWACAAARLAGKEGPGAGKVGGGRVDSKTKAKERVETEPIDLGNETDEGEEVHEAVTPTSSIGRRDVRWGSGRDKADIVQDEDVMRAALALCGLGQRR